MIFAFVLFFAGTAIFLYYLGTAQFFSILFPQVYTPTPKAETVAILISGGSNGIGKDAALKLVEKNFTVLAGVRKQSDADRLKAEAKFPEKMIPVFLDVTKPEDLESAIQTTLSVCKEKKLSFYGIVLAAGISGHLVPAEMNPELRNVLEVNFFGNVSLTQLALPYLRQVKGSRIVVISSVAGIFPTGLMSSYCSSKFALEGFYNSLRRELYGRDISVSIINAGAIRTDIWNSIQDSTLMENHLQ